MISLGLIFEGRGKKVLCCIIQSYAAIDILWYYFYYYLIYFKLKYRNYHWFLLSSGKKFKGPEFVNKHIFNKHGEKVEEVKKEVKFFNSYLKDPRRPQLPEHPTNKPGNSMHKNKRFKTL